MGAPFGSTVDPVQDVDEGTCRRTGDDDREAGARVPDGVRGELAGE